MKKKILIILLALIIPICLLFVGCGTKSENYQDNSSERFVIIEKVQDEFEGVDGITIDIYIVVDKETRIMYFYCSGFESFEFETMLDKDGKPLLYEGEL